MWRPPLNLELVVAVAILLGMPSLVRTAPEARSTGRPGPLASSSQGGATGPYLAQLGRDLEPPSGFGETLERPTELGGELEQASPLQTQNDVIAEIEVEGLRRVREEAALANIESETGEPLEPAVVTRDIRSIWNTGFFRDVRALKERVEGGWRLVFVVEEKPAVREIRYKGYDDISKSDITDVTSVEPYTILDVDLIEQNVQKIRNLYVEKGYYLADVTYSIEPVEGSPNQVDILFRIDENAKVTIKQISIVGNEHLSDDKIKSVLVRTRVGNELSFLTKSGTYKEEFFQADLFQIQGLYFDNGFINAKVGEPSTRISPDRRYIYITIPIQEGKRYRIGNIDFGGEVALTNEQGETVVDAETLQIVLNVQAGEIFNRSKLLKDVQAVTDIYRNQGYAYANVSPNSRTRPDERLVDLQFQIQPGQVVRFGRIEIVGNELTRDKVIRRELRIYEQERYSAAKLKESRARVYQLGYFENVDVSTERGAEPDLMDVIITVKEKSTGTFQIGAGFSTFESFIATAQISQNNFLGQGWSLSLQAQLSFGQFARQLATLQFFEPYLFDSRWSFGLDAYITQRFYRDFQRNATGFSPRLGYPLTDDLRLSASYTLEQIGISTDFQGLTTPEPALATLNVDGLNSALSLSLSYDTRDNRLFPSSGQFHTLSGEVSNPALGTDEGLAYCRTEASFRNYFPLPWSFVFKTSARFGYVFCGGDDGVPISERFFPGGIFSVRGFQPRSMGATVPVVQRGQPLSEAQDFIIGGNKQAIFNVELEFPILQAAGIKGVLFADAGNAFDDDQNFFFIDTPPELQTRGFSITDGEPVSLPAGLFYSVGFGIRWFSPIGPLRFEWGIPLIKQDPDAQNVVFEFTIGNFF